MSARQLFVVRHGETFLKGRNRHWFEDLLARNIRRALATVGDVAIDRAQGRFFVRAPTARSSRSIEALKGVFGISSISPAVEVAPAIEAISEAATSSLGQLLGRRKVGSFKVETNRSDKRFPIPSPEVSRQVGAAICEQLGLSVDLHHPELVVGIEIGRVCSFVFVERITGAGGLPVGAGGHAMLLLSGGIDSPVAGHLAQKRGCTLRAIYFHSPPHTGEHARDKVTRLAARLAGNQGSLALHVVGFSAIQQMLRDQAPAELLVVLYRRAMMRIASVIARRHGALALLTGDSLGQVASQTLKNLGCIEQATQLPVLRPLLTYDKQQTIAIARHIGTFDISIEPYQDCCSLFVPRHPATAVGIARAQRAEARIGLGPLITETAQSAEMIEVAAEEAPR